MPTIEEQLEAARVSLLDLSMHNRMLNYREAKARTIRVVEEVPREVYDFLVLAEKAMEFRPQPETSEPEETATRPNALGAADDAPEVSEIWSLPVGDEEAAAAQHTDKYLQTNLEAEALQKRLFYVSQQARSAFEE